ncbi:PREDICTED: protein wntless homolog, partial [Eurypyga helias]|uniref:protein wntless homolog n=1 Tax=Eurypyga helias TaxID=54383 RepID=UPI00052897C0
MDRSGRRHRVHRRSMCGVGCAVTQPGWDVCVWQLGCELTVRFPGAGKREQVAGRARYRAAGTSASAPHQVPVCLGSPFPCLGSCGGSRPAPVSHGPLRAAASRQHRRHKCFCTYLTLLRGRWFCNHLPTLFQRLRLSEFGDLDILISEGVPLSEPSPSSVPEENAEITLDVSLAYRDNTFDDWKEIAHAIEIRKLKCTFGSPKTLESEGRHYDCDFLPFMEIGSVAHKYYLINIRLPVNERKGINVGIGEIKDIRLVGIHQNGGFTKVWFAMKTFLTPSILIIMVWYWRRITLMTRAPVLLEKVIFALGISMTFINIPVEWFSIGFDWTWMLLFGDIRQGIFYAMLLSFWIIFCGEHMMDQNERNRLSGYWKQVGPIAVGSFCLFIFDMCERGVQLKNPFYSIWTTEVGTELAMAFIIVAGICLCLYFLFLCFMVFQVFRNISGKQSSLPAMSKARRLHYEGLIFRFKFLMLITLACAAMTVIFFIVSQVLPFTWQSSLNTSVWQG